VIADETLQNLVCDLQDELGPSARWQELEDAVADLHAERTRLRSVVRGIASLVDPEWLGEG
jgi:hypothetical protein